MSRPNVTVDGENIPDELKQRDQWLLWDARNDRPKQPHWDGDHRINWSDPDDWHSFDEAIEAAQRVPSWGVGYVTAADNDDHPRGVYGVIDIDGAADETDTPHDWMPSIKPIIGEGGDYVEWSPSHGEPGDSGLHIPVWNIDVPDWWSDTEHPDREHTGVDVLTNKFCTFTGDVEVGGEIVEYDDDIEAWLADAYEALTGETAPPRQDNSLGDYGTDSGTDSTPDEEWLDRDAAEDALSYISPDVKYPKWRNIGFALQSHFADHVAERLFKSWSRRGSKYDDEAEDHVERIIDDADENGDVGISKLVKEAKRGGWDASAAARERLADSGTTASAGELKEAPRTEPGTGAGSRVRVGYRSQRERRPVGACVPALR
jgi:Uncharacterized conserved protein